MPKTKKKSSYRFNTIIKCNKKYCSKSKNVKKCMKQKCNKEYKSLFKKN